MIRRYYKLPRRGTRTIAAARSSTGLNLTLPDRLPKEFWNTLSKEQIKVWQRVKMDQERTKGTAGSTTSQPLPQQYRNRQVNMAATEPTEEDMEVQECTGYEEPLPEEPEQVDDAADDGTVDIADYTARACAMIRSINMARTVTGISPSRLIAAESRVTQGTGLADGGADTIVCGVGWMQQSTTARTATIKGFSDDHTKTEIPIGTAISATTTSTGSTILLQANEALQMPQNQYTILSALQLREHGVQVHDVARRHGGGSMHSSGRLHAPSGNEQWFIYRPTKKKSDARRQRNHDGPSTGSDRSRSATRYVPPPHDLSSGLTPFHHRTPPYSGAASPQHAPPPPPKRHRNDHGRRRHIASVLRTNGHTPHTKNRL